MMVKYGGAAGGIGGEDKSGDKPQLLFGRVKCEVTAQNAPRS